jgi:hypothetical protein
MSVIDRLRKRRFYPVTIDGETIHIRALLDSELRLVEPFRFEDASIGFAIGCSLLNEDKSPAFVMEETESPQQFGHRVLNTLDLPQDTKAEVRDKIVKLSEGPPETEDLKKN